MYCTVLSIPPFSPKLYKSYTTDCWSGRHFLSYVPLVLKVSKINTSRQNDLRSSGHVRVLQEKGLKKYFDLASI